MAHEIDDARTGAEKAATCGFVVCEDSFMSGWGKAKGGRSLYALAILDGEQEPIVTANAHARSEMKRVRFNLQLPRLRDGDHLKIVGPTAAARWYERGGFTKKVN